MTRAPLTDRLWLWAYLTLTGLARPLIARHLTKRAARGKEDPARRGERFGVASAPRPDGQLVWVHAVGLGEALAIRALLGPWVAAGMAVLVTTQTKGAAEALEGKLPARALHQYLPMDVAPWLDRFLDHWRPDLVVWAEQEVWPGAVARVARRGIPQALVNARMNAAAHARRARLRPFARAMLGPMALVSAQDTESAAHLADLGAGRLNGVTPRVDGSLKPAAPPLPDIPELREPLEGRAWWAAVSTHPGDEALVLDALSPGTDRPLLMAPRRVDRVPVIAEAAQARGLVLGRDLFLVGQTGVLGPYLRLADLVWIGGTRDDIEGHSPWEAAILGCAIAHGPRIGNFRDDYAALEGVALRPETATELRVVLTLPDLAERGAEAARLAARQRAGIEALAQDVLTLIGPAGD